MSPNLSWRKSSYSAGNNGDCVELACATNVRAIRDSKNSAGPVLLFSQDAAQRFLAGVQSGRYDH